MANAIEAGKVRAARQGLSNLAFTLGDASQWTAQPKSSMLRDGARRRADGEGVGHSDVRNGLEDGQKYLNQFDNKREESATVDGFANNNKAEDNEGAEGVDLVVALHACGSLSDVAMAQAVRHQAGFLVCPCCYLANQKLQVPVALAPSAATGLSTGRLSCLPCKLSSSIPSEENVATSAPSQIIETSGTTSENSLEEENAAEVHPSAAAAIAVTPSVWLGVDKDRHLSLLRAAELQGDGATAAEAMHAVAALRAEATKRHWQEGWARRTAGEDCSSGEEASSGGSGKGSGSGHSDENASKNEVKEANSGIKVVIKQFPLAYSTRNLCIVGIPE